MPSPPTLRLTRRAVLLGTAGTVVLAACGGEDGGSDSAATTLGLEEAGVILAPTFNPGPGYASAGVPQRLTWSLRDANNAPVADPPAELSFQFFYEGSRDQSSGETGDHEPVGDPVVASRFDEGIPIPYWPSRFTPEDVGFYSVAVTVDGQEVTSAFQVEPQAEVPMIEVGEPMPAIETPTVEDARGVTPICTREPECELHGQTLTQALAAGRPTAFLIGTPEFCQTGICGPVLDLLIEAAPDFPGITFLHAEVYNNPRNDSGDPTVDGLTPAIEECGLSFEPTLYLVGTDGVVADRLDNIYDTVELREALGALA